MNHTFRLILALCFIVLLTFCVRLYTKPNPPKERYFHISTHYVLENNSGEGHYTFSYKGNEFPSTQYIQSTVIEEGGKASKNKITGVVVLYMYEFESEEDFNDFNKN